MIRCLLVAAVIFLAGCVGPAIIPEGAGVAGIKQIHVVAMESPPLGMGAKLLDFPVGVAVMGDATARGAGALILAQSILMVLKAPEAIRQAQQRGETFRSTLDSAKPWLPTRALANEVAAQLGSRGFAVTIAPEPRPIPGLVDRSPSLTMENWLAPIRAWYNGSGPVVDSRGTAPEAQAHVLEVGISLYEVIPDDKFILSIMIKIVDPSTGRVIGRARAANAGALPNLSPLASTFANDADRFKHVFSLESRKLVDACLKELGLIHR
jgi:hypothetical protein